MKYYLAKTDPDSYSISDLEREKSTEWSGVRNPQAVQFLKSMQPQDRVFIYHSQGEGSLRGLAEVQGAGHADPANPKSWLVTLRLLHVYEEPFVTIKDIRATDLFPDFLLLRQSRLSVLPVPKEVVQFLKKKKVQV